MELAILFQMTFIGMPCVFYGDEKGMMGITEQEYRMPMTWNEQNPLSDIYKKMITMRKNNPALSHGTYTTIKTDGMMLHYAREWDGQCIEIAVNPGKTPVSYSLYGDVLLKKGYACDLLMPNGYVVTRSVSHGMHHL